MAFLMVDDRRVNWVHITLHCPSCPFRASLFEMVNFFNFRRLVLRFTRQGVYLNLMHLSISDFYFNFFGGPLSRPLARFVA